MVLPAVGATWARSGANLGSGTAAAAGSGLAETRGMRAASATTPTHRVVRFLNLTACSPRQRPDGGLSVPLSACRAPTLSDFVRGVAVYELPPYSEWAEHSSGLIGLQLGGDPQGEDRDDPVEPGVEPAGELISLVRADVQPELGLLGPQDDDRV